MEFGGLLLTNIAEQTCNGTCVSHHQSHLLGPGSFSGKMLHNINGAEQGMNNRREQLPTAPTFPGFL